MSKEDWKWYGGTDDEFFTEGPFDSREECIDECSLMGLGDFDGGFHIIEARKDNLKLSAHFDADIFLENADERAFDDYGGEDPTFEVTGEQSKDLEFVVRAAIDRWQKHHGLTFTPWVFTNSRNGEYVHTDEGEDEDMNTRT